MNISRRFFLKAASTVLLATATTPLYPLEKILELNSGGDIYVDPINGKPFPFHDGRSKEKAFRTLQEAWDSLPDTIHSRVTIHLLDGVHYVGPLKGSVGYDLPKPAILFKRGTL